MIKPYMTAGLLLCTGLLALSGCSDDNDVALNDAAPNNTDTPSAGNPGTDNHHVARHRGQGTRKKMFAKNGAGKPLIWH